MIKGWVRQPEYFYIRLVFITRPCFKIAFFLSHFENWSREEEEEEEECALSPDWRSVREGGRGEEEGGRGKGERSWEKGGGGERKTRGEREREGRRKKGGRRRIFLVCT